MRVDVSDGSFSEVSGPISEVRSAPMTDILRHAGHDRKVQISEVTRRAIDAFLERAMKREVGPNTKSCTNLWGPIRVLV
jgi:hypothetical protein